MSNPNAPASTTPSAKITKVRRTVEDRLAEAEARVAALRDRQTDTVVLAAVKAGHVSDPKAAAKLARKIKALRVARDTIVACGWAEAKAVNDEVAKAANALRQLVRQPAPATKG